MYRLPILFIFFSLLCGCSQSQRITPIIPSPIPMPSYPQVRMPPPCMPPEMIHGLSRKEAVPHHNVLVIIDPGHGGEDFGTHSNSQPRYEEKNLNLATANMLASYLTQQGYPVILTRNDNSFIALDKRAAFANERGCTLFVSVHYNSAPSKDADGIEVFYYRSSDNQERTKASRSLANAVLEKVIKNTQAKSRGTKHGDFAVIRLTKMPAILIEGGFLTNDAEMQRIKDPSYLKKIAWGISEGIIAFLNDL